MALKRMEVVTKTIGDATFYIKPFGAFTSANLSGELAKIISPFIGGILPAVSAVFGKLDLDVEKTQATTTENTGDIMDMQLDDAIGAFTDAFSTLSGDKIEQLMMQLLINNQNISVNCYATEDRPQLLTKDLADEIFCTDIQDMYILCFEVIRINFKGFFKKLGGRFGKLQGIIQRLTPSTANTDTSMQASSAN